MTEEGLKRIYMPSGKLLWEGGLSNGKREGDGTLFNRGKKLFEGTLLICIDNKIYRDSIHKIYLKYKFLRVLGKRFERGTWCIIQ